MITRNIKIKEIGEIVTGKTPPTKSKEYYGDDYVFIKPTYINMDSRYFDNVVEKVSTEAFEKYKSSFVPANSVCVVTIGSIGEKICLTKEISLTNQAINTIVPFTDKYDNIFVYYLLKYNLFKVKAMNNGTSSGRENVSKTAFENIEVECPDLPTQKRIAKILSSYDDLIENNLKRITLLEETAELLYKEWFVYFRFPGYDKCEFIEGVPSGWSKIKLGAHIEFLKGKKPKNILEISSENSVPYLLVDVLEGDKFLYTEDSEVPIALENEVIMIMDGSRSGTIYKSIYGAIGSTMAIIRVNKNVLDNEYLYYFLKLNQTHIKQNNTGSAIPHANKEFIKDMDIIIPEKSIVKKFNTYAKNISKQISYLKLQNNRLKEARDILIPKLMRGEIEV
ncbi:restriction endonuclease subunit S [Heyndrickxia sporothermodurans]